MRVVSVQHNPQKRGGNHGEFAVDRVGYRLVPCERRFCCDPSHRQTPELEHRYTLQSAHQDEEHQRHQGQSQCPAVDTPTRKRKPGPGCRYRHGEIHRSFMVAAKPHHPQRRAGERGARHRPMAPHRPQQEGKDKRCPNGEIEQGRPVGIRQEISHGPEKPAQQRRRAGASQRPA